MQNAQSRRQVKPLHVGSGLVKVFAHTRPCRGTGTNGRQIPPKKEASGTPQRLCNVKSQESRQPEGICTTSPAAPLISAPRRPQQAWRSLSSFALGCLLCCMLACTLASSATATASSSSSSSWSIQGMLKGALDFVLHLDHHLGQIIAANGQATYAILFAIVFAETGLVLTPFLPGDSLLFAAGAFAALGALSLPLLLATFVSAAILGDTVNYAVGGWLGAKALESKLISTLAVQRTELFYARHGGRAVVLARFLPIIRTFAPFLAGMGRMDRGQFARFNVGGALLWVGTFTGAGHLFGNLPWVQDNFAVLVLAIVAVSLLPVMWELWQARREGHAGNSNLSDAGASMK